ncbi:MAG: nucleotidyl transferase AbiEii/AbiGii toxin family protein [Anaerolineaceae bacterium]|jgi:predicted nucleotidyltransferase component of viral defense system|nr:nucleotidyl transferase AbiEii/AbiGii toxin family protein [Anaerolineaceae bacterium]
MSPTLFPQTLPVHTARLLRLFEETRPAFLTRFYLSGGTALSLHLGHRESEDLDFFCEQSFQPQEVERQIRSLGTLSQTELEKGTLNTFLDGVKLQFLEYPYPTLKSFIKWQGIQISSIIDIACTKLQTVSARGSKKDFIDIYFLLKKYSLETLLAYTREKYSHSDYSETHILKSLVYFSDADDQPMPRMCIQVSWEQIKKELVSAVKSIDLH